LRFARLKETTPNVEVVKQAASHPLALIRTAYNAVFWIFLVPFLTRVDFKIGFIAFSTVILVRLVLNLYTNNFLKNDPQIYESYPFRIP
jgi:hypothetical protein